MNRCIISASIILILVAFSPGGAALLGSECRDKNYISRAADYILEGTVEKVESKLMEGKSSIYGTSIFTYSNLSIEKYVKGTPIKGNEVQIVTLGGTAEGISQWVEDQPTFREGMKVRVYLQETEGGFILVCAELGVEEISGNTGAIPAEGSPTASLTEKAAGFEIALAITALSVVYILLRKRK